MTFDGTRALVVGDYTTRSTGAHAGQLGPWHLVVERIGIAPRSTAIKLIFVTFGVAWLVIAFAMLRGVHWARTAMLVVAVLTLWYLPVGTALSIVEIALLWR